MLQLVHRSVADSGLRIKPVTSGSPVCLGAELLFVKSSLLDRPTPVCGSGPPVRRRNLPHWGDAEGSALLWPHPRHLGVRWCHLRVIDPPQDVQRRWAEPAEDTDQQARRSWIQSERVGRQDLHRRIKTCRQKQTRRLWSFISLFVCCSVQTVWVRWSTGELRKSCWWI